MRKTTFELITSIFAGISSVLFLCLFFTIQDYNKAQKIYCIQKYKNDVYKYQHCNSTNFAKILQEEE